VNFNSSADTAVLTILLDFFQWVDLNCSVNFVARSLWCCLVLDVGKYFLVYESRNWIWLVIKARKVLVKS